METNVSFSVRRWVLPAYRRFFLDYDTRVTILYGGAGSGKSYAAVQKVVAKALKMKRRILVVRKVAATIKSSIWDLFFEILGDRPVVSSINRTEMIVDFINGSRIMFKGLDDPEKIKSIQGITDIVVEEATEISLDDYTQLVLRLRANAPQAQITLMFNPVSKANWVYAYFFEHGAPPGVKIIHTTYKDNDRLPEDYVRSLMELERRNPAYFRIYVLGEFATLDKLVFPIFEKRLISPDETKDGYTWVGLDFGYSNDPTAITWGSFIPGTNRLFITGEYHKTGMTNDEIAEAVKSLGLAKEVIIADSAEPKSIEELRRLGLTRIRASIKGQDSVKVGIDRMQRCEIIIDERCVHTVEEFENYTWERDRKTGEYYNRPIDTYNHHIDSIRYGLQSVIGKRPKDEEYRPMWAM